MTNRITTKRTWAGGSLAAPEGPDFELKSAAVNWALSTCPSASISPFSSILNIEPAAFCFINKGTVHNHGSIPVAIFMAGPLTLIR